MAHVIATWIVHDALKPIKSGSLYGNMIATWIVYFALKYI